MNNEDCEIEKLESEFPAVSGRAFAEARQRVLDSGQSVLQVEGSWVVRVYPDGRKEVVKEIEPPTTVKVGTVFMLH